MILFIFTGDMKCLSFWKWKFKDAAQAYISLIFHIKVKHWKWHCQWEGKPQVFGDFLMYVKAAAKPKPNAKYVTLSSVEEQI